MLKIDNILIFKKEDLIRSESNKHSYEIDIYSFKNTDYALIRKYGVISFIDNNNKIHILKNRYGSSDDKNTLRKIKIAYRNYKLKKLSID